MHKITLSKELSLPLEFATRTISIFGLRGAGKTNTASVVVEELLELGLPPVIIDPTDAWWGLRSEFPVFIFGGSHGDMPLHETDGKTVAQFVVSERVPVVLSLRHMRKGAQRRLVTDFCEEIYHLKGRDENRTALTVIIDECPLFVPQRVLGEAARTVGAVEDLIARGRSSGFGVVLISQRPATVNKDVLTQCDAIITHRITSPQDRKALSEWFDANTDSEKQREILGSLSALPAGKAWVWAPTLDTMQMVQIRKRRTFDSSATPKIGEVIVPPKKLTEVNLDQLKGKMADALKQAKDNDPATLKAKIRELEAKLAKPAPAIVTAPPERIEVEVLSQATVNTLSYLQHEMKNTGEFLNALIMEVRQRASKQPAVLPVPTFRPPAPPSTVPKHHGAGTESLPKAERMILTCLAQFGPCSKSKVAIITEYSVTGGSFNNALGALRTKEYITRSEPMEITQLGLAALGDYANLPTGKELQAHWLRQLPKAEGLILGYLCKILPAGGTKEQVAEATGYEATGGSFNNALGRLRTLELITRGSPIYASEHLFQ